MLLPLPLSSLFVFFFLSSSSLSVETTTTPPLFNRSAVTHKRSREHHLFPPLLSSSPPPFLSSSSSSHPLLSSSHRLRSAPLHPHPLSLFLAFRPAKKMPSPPFGGHTALAYSPSSDLSAPFSPHSTKGSFWSHTSSHGYHWSLPSPCDRQSPIHIDYENVSISADKSGDVYVQYTDVIMDADVENNGHSIEVSPLSSPFGVVYVQGRAFSVCQFHFHAPAEHTFGKAPVRGGTQHEHDTQKEEVLRLDAKYPRRDLEMHIVHKPEDGKKGDTVVLGVTFIPSPSNTPNAFLGSLLSLPSFPPPLHQHITPTTSLVGLGVLVPPPPSFLYRYKGSLTTPPLSQGVVWLLLESPVEASVEQLAQMKRSLFVAHREETGNYRLIQNSPLVNRNPANVTKVGVYSTAVKNELRGRWERRMH
eukprot:GHVS01078960.1.p1 GENE.GHVS01078960.1~~GHVS01078960.1.p1  ORF type:complete len:418 (+),score=100.92 GHVS01078960.1:240-1493(+)